MQNHYANYAMAIERAFLPTIFFNTLWSLDSRRYLLFVTQFFQPDFYAMGVLFRTRWTLKGYKGKISPATWRPCFSMNHDGLNNLSIGSQKEHFCEVILKSVRWFLTRRFLEFSI